MLKRQNACKNKPEANVSQNSPSAPPVGQTFQPIITIVRNFPPNVKGLFVILHKKMDFISSFFPFSSLCFCAFSGIINTNRQKKNADIRLIFG